MATGHLNPGYTDPVSRLPRARAALYSGTARPGAQNLRELQDVSVDPNTLEDIRRRAREVWMHRDQSQTSYQDHFRERFSAVDEPTKQRPTSAHRWNNRHPPL